MPRWKLDEFRHVVSHCYYLSTVLVHAANLHVDCSAVIPSRWNVPRNRAGFLSSPGLGWWWWLIHVRTHDIWGSYKGMCRPGILSVALVTKLASWMTSRPLSRDSRCRSRSRDVREYPRFSKKVNISCAFCWKSSSTQYIRRTSQELIVENALLAV